MRRRTELEYSYQLEGGSQSTFVPGSLRWIAPELLKPELIGSETAELSTQTDTWSFGMPCLELLTGSQPFFAVRLSIYLF